MLEKIGSECKLTNIFYVKKIMIDIKFVSIIIFLLFILLNPFFFNYLIFSYRLIYSISYAFCFGISFSLVNVLLKMNHKIHQISYVSFSFLVYATLSIIVSFFFTLSIRLVLDVFLDFGFVSGETITKKELFNLFLEVVEVVIFIEFFLFFLSIFNLNGDAELEEKSTLLNKTAKKDSITSGLKVEEIKEIEENCVLDTVTKELNKTGEMRSENTLIAKEKEAVIEKNILNFVANSVGVVKEGKGFGLLSEGSNEVLNKKNFLTDATTVKKRKKGVFQKELKIKGVNKGEEFIVCSSLIVYIKAEGHYVKIFYYSEEYKKIKFELIRSSMKSIETCLMDVYPILRIHKSYFVSLNYVKYVRINVKGGMLCLTKDNIRLTLSKTYINEVKERVKMYYGNKIGMYF